MMLRILIPSAFALPAENEVHDHFLLAHHFGRTIRHVKINNVQSLNVVTMAYLHHLMLMFWSPDCEWKTSSLLIYGGGGTFQNNYIMPEYYQKGFSPTMVKDSFLVICLKFFTQTFGIFHTKPKLLISWYYLWVQISKAAQLLSVICKFQLPCLDHFFLPSRLKNCAKQLKDIPWLCTKHLSVDSVMKIDRMFFFFSAEENEVNSRISHSNHF